MSDSAVTRRTLLHATVAAPIIGTFTIRSRAAVAAEFKYKFGNNLPFAHPMNIRATEAASRIREESGGRLDIQVFPNNQLGGDTDMLSQLRYGALECFTISGLILANIIPVTSIYGLAFAIKDYDTAWSAVDGELGRYLRHAIGKAGIHSLDRMWDNGFRHITSSSKPIISASDLRGFKIRVPISPLWTSMFKAFGAAPTGINWSETYSALQTKIVDGCENSLIVIDLAKLYEIQKYLSLTSHM